jgi:Rrf2 family iron-sulfur cluster assembly transcriptional regulator
MTMKTLRFISPIIGGNTEAGESRNILTQQANNNVEKLETTSRGRHALTAMVDLTLMQADRPVPLSDIAARRQISLSYLEQMFAGLRRNGLVKSHRGPGGGYRLGKPTTQISVAEILRAAEDSPSAQRNRQAPRRATQAECPSTKLWESLNAHTYDLLDQVSLDDVVNQRNDVYQRLFRQNP